MKSEINIFNIELLFFYVVLFIVFRVVVVYALLLQFIEIYHLDLMYSKLILRNLTPIFIASGRRDQ